MRLLTIAICGLLVSACAGEITFSDEMGDDGLHSPLMVGTTLNLAMEAPGRNIGDMTVSAENPAVLDIDISAACFLGCSSATGHLEARRAGATEVVVNPTGQSEVLASFDVEVAAPDRVALIALDTDERVNPADTLVLHSGGEAVFLIDARIDDRVIFGPGSLRFDSTDPEVVTARVFRSSRAPTRAFVTFVGGSEGDARVELLLGDDVLATFAVTTTSGPPASIELVSTDTVVSAVVRDASGTQLRGAMPIWLVNGIVVTTARAELLLVPDLGSHVEVQSCMRDIDDREFCTARDLVGLRFDHAVAELGAVPENLKATGSCAQSTWETSALGLLALAVLCARRVSGCRRGSSRARGERSRC